MATSTAAKSSADLEDTDTRRPLRVFVFLGDGADARVLDTAPFRRLNSLAKMTAANHLPDLSPSTTDVVVVPGGCARTATATAKRALRRATRRYISICVRRCATDEAHALGADGRDALKRYVAAGCRACTRAHVCARGSGRWGQVAATSAFAQAYTRECTRDSARACMRRSHTDARIHVCTQPCPPARALETQKKKARTSRLAMPPSFVRGRIPPVAATWTHGVRVCERTLLLHDSWPGRARVTTA